MVKRLIAILVVVAVVVIVVVAAIRRDNFKSMVLRDDALNGVVPEATTTAPQPIAPVEIEATDSLTVITSDSL